MEERIKRLEKLNLEEFNKTRKVRIKENNTPIQLVKTYNDSEIVWEEEKEEKKNPFKDLI